MVPQAYSHSTLTVMLDTSGERVGRLGPKLRVILQVYTPEALLLMLVNVTEADDKLAKVGGFSSSVVLLDQL